ncbi:hypothetical protein DICPUDRAFT_79210 [Dictyostelium purpureum]|uniref:ADF-H domain-containing protein n=1 Tax=Dictyostelium purpureum TaxID=5786 RepID=F0ZLW6_DICPU|nr:uncharacterized protein DICPUDRAFT_79210 [Dictyostelium purpureum]EGC35058.1 hypothetical protein DICPUDRAFT_79210 [Dictyostelium purpureum]|eukprot:XP_003288426.1 hypothetical protein DICPUDRAFT_79210 [Dictyostelium purpureum]
MNIDERCIEEFKKLKNEVCNHKQSNIGILMGIDITSSEKNIKFISNLNSDLVDSIKSSCSKTNSRFIFIGSNKKINGFGWLPDTVDNSEEEAFFQLGKNKLLKTLQVEIHEARDINTLNGLIKKYK